MSISEQIKNQIGDFLKTKTDELATEVLASVPDPELQAEAERLRRPEKPKPSAEALAEASRLGTEVAPEIRDKIFTKLEKEILPLIDELVAVHQEVARLTYSSSGFYLSNFLNEIKGALNQYENAVSLGRRPVPAYTEIQKKK